MERIPGYNELMTHTEDNFFPKELTSYGLSHRDKVLLTLRLIRGVRYEDFILEDLSERGRKAYKDLFANNEDLPNDVMIDILMNLDTIEEIIKLRASSSRFYQLTQDPKIISTLFQKFYDKFQKDGTLLNTKKEFPEYPKTFEKFLEWYGTNTYDTNKCAEFHGIIACIKNAIQKKNGEKVRSLTRQFLNDSRLKEDIYNGILWSSLTIRDVKAMIDYEPKKEMKKRIFETIYVTPSAEGKYIAIQSANLIGFYNESSLDEKIKNNLFFTLASEVNANLEKIFVNNDFYEKDGFCNGINMPKTNIYAIYRWCILHGRISPALLGIALARKDYENASMLIKVIEKTPENVKKVRNTIELLDDCGNSSKVQMYWLNKNWK